MAPPCQRQFIRERVDEQRVGVLRDCGVAVRPARERAALLHVGEADARLIGFVDRAPAYAREQRRGGEVELRHVAVADTVHAAHVEVDPRWCQALKSTGPLVPRK